MRAYLSVHNEKIFFLQNYWQNSDIKKVLL